MGRDGGEGGHVKGRPTGTMRAKGDTTRKREEKSIRFRLNGIARPGHGSVPAWTYVEDVQALLSIIDHQRASLDEWVRLACKR